MTRTTKADRLLDELLRTLHDRRVRLLAQVAELEAEMKRVESAAAALLAPKEEP